ncbi:MAG: hypothetical protein IBX40_07230 [Methanosarcinales archaeon]|nr:hypothetical protein [Methanosarcinales archaeon]
MCKLCEILGSLPAPGVQELAALEDENMATIEKVYQRLRDDKKIQPQIERIKAHPWMRGVKAKMLVKSSPHMEPEGLHTCAARYWPE